MLGLCCECLTIGAGEVNPLGTLPSTGGGDGRNGRDRWASGLTTASETPRPMEEKLGVGIDHSFRDTPSHGGEIGRRIDPVGRQGNHYTGGLVSTTEYSIMMGRG